MKTVTLNKHVLKSPIIFPPAVCFNWSDEKGYETIDRSKHYGIRAKGGTGLIIIEATGIMPEGLIVKKQLGLWEDGQIEQFEKIASACHAHDTKVIVQLVHAGSKSSGDVVYGPSSLSLETKSCLELTTESIAQITQNFVDAAVRAERAGLDGIEIHGAHGYLLNQFTSSKTNLRTDAYGGSLENRLRFPFEVLQAIKAATSDTFIISYRFGVNDPTFVEDIYFAKSLEEKGVHLLNVSSGIPYGSYAVPESFQFSNTTYLGVAIKAHVNIPTACVYGIRQPEQAQALLDSGTIDCVAVCKGILSDPEWANKFHFGGTVDACYDCKPNCRYASDGFQCPWMKKAQTE